VLKIRQRLLCAAAVVGQPVWDARTHSSHAFRVDAVEIAASKMHLEKRLFGTSFPSMEQRQGHWMFGHSMLFSTGSRMRLSTAQQAAHFLLSALLPAA
jgi:hypothetical protein